MRELGNTLGPVLADPRCCSSCSAAPYPHEHVQGNHLHHHSQSTIPYFVHSYTTEPKSVGSESILLHHTAQKCEIRIHTWR